MAGWLSEAKAAALRTHGLQGGGRFASARNGKSDERAYTRRCLVHVRVTLLTVPLVSFLRDAGPCKLALTHVFARFPWESGSGLRAGDLGSLFVNHWHPPVTLVSWAIEDVQVSQSDQA